ncbi:hypothetical protein H072_2422 [Dactylellina haptotyla CBS 200.50]|uniref:Uncharacterized protein n=1 Tax=Dactylellina haptotyla (strain CBS 200.50) TaxID=1284197 RepID=S8BVZ5_DACHA|nr:hypothetical protein H072_2422 [Dactylellina haptotyla CBS 200.50]
MTSKAERTRSSKKPKNQDTQELRPAGDGEHTETTPASNSPSCDEFIAHQNHSRSAKRKKQRSGFYLTPKRPTSDDLPATSSYSKELASKLLNISLDDVTHISKVIDDVYKSDEGLLITVTTKSRKKEWLKVMTDGIRENLDEDILAYLDSCDHATVGYILFKRALTQKSVLKRLNRYDEKKMANTSSPPPTPDISNDRISSRRLKPAGRWTVESSQGTPPSLGRSDVGTSETTTPEVEGEASATALMDPITTEQPDDKEELQPAIAASRPHKKRRPKALKRIDEEKNYRICTMALLILIILSLWGILFIFFLVVRGQAYTQQQMFALYYGIRDRGYAMLER